MTRCRRIIAIACSTVGFILAATLGGYVLVTQWRPALQGDERWGIDVSHHQGVIDWDRVGEDNIDYAYIKSTEGETLVDEKFAANWAGAGDAGISRGAYHFFSLCSAGAGQARNFLTTVPADVTALPPAVDLEFGACTERPDPATVERDLRDFIAAVEAEQDGEVVLYILPAFAELYPFVTELDREQWARRIARRPTRDWVVWQASNTAHIDGIEGFVDLNVWRPR